MTQKLANKVALITGGGSGIGFATAQEFVAHGATVYITGRNQEALTDAAQKLDASVIAIQADSSKPEDIDKTISIIEANGHRLDVLFYNAGIAQFAPLSDLTEASFDQTFSINVKGALFTVQKSLRILNDNASILFNGSAAVHTGLANTSIYSASKASLNSLAKTLSRELVDRGIRANVINPGPVETPIYGKLGLPKEAVDAFAADVGAQIPLKRFGQPEEIAKVVAFLASSESSFIVGTEITADGGFTQI